MLLALDPHHNVTKHMPEEEEEQEEGGEGSKLCYLRRRTTHARHWTVKRMGCKVHLCCSMQDPVEDAVYVGFDVLGVLTSGDDWDTTLHIPLQAHLRDQHHTPSVEHPAGNKRKKQPKMEGKKEREEEEEQEDEQVEEDHDKSKSKNKRRKVYAVQES